MLRPVRRKVEHNWVACGTTRGTHDVAKSCAIYGGIPICQTLNFSNLLISQTNFLFPWINFSVILPLISRTPDFVSLGGSRNLLVCK